MEIYVLYSCVRRYGSREVKEDEQIIVGLEHAENWYKYMLDKIKSEVAGDTNYTVIVELLKPDVSPYTGFLCFTVGSDAVHRYVQMADKDDTGVPRTGVLGRFYFRCG